MHGMPPAHEVSVDEYEARERLSCAAPCRLLKQQLSAWIPGLLSGSRPGGLAASVLDLS